MGERRQKRRAGGNGEDVGVGQSGLGEVLASRPLSCWARGKASQDSGAPAVIARA
jgi:hypothetical protein